MAYEVELFTLFIGHKMPRCTKRKLTSKDGIALSWNKSLKVVRGKKIPFAAAAKQFKVIFNEARKKTRTFLSFRTIISMAYE